MATDFKALQAIGDALLEAGTAKGNTFQDEYLAENGRYAQCIQTPAEMPSDGVKLATDKDAKPTYQAEAWDDLGFAIPVQSEVCMRIDTYEGPNGKDWAATVAFDADGIRYYKTIAAVGVEATSTDWIALKITDPLVLRGRIVQPIDSPIDPAISQ